MIYLLKVKIIPNSSTHQIVNWENDYLKIRLKGVPEKGKLNEELIRFLSKLLNLSQQSIILSKGTTSRVKTLKITTDQDLIAMINSHLSS